MRRTIQMKGKQILFLLLLLMLAGCATPPTGDLFTGAQSSRATADAANQLAYFQEQFLTASAQAPIIDITSTAAAFAMEQSYAQATSAAGAQTQIAAMTVTAQSWTPTPNAESTAMFLALNAQSTQTALSLQRQEISNQFNAIRDGVILIFGLLAVSVLLMLFVRRERNKPATVDERGRIIPIIDTVHGTVVDIERMPNYRGTMIESLLEQWLRKRFDLPPLLPEITAERQDQVTARAQLVDLATRARLPKRLLDEQEQLLLPASLQSMDNKFVLPSWELINSWDGKNGIPYYTANGLETIDIERFPHLSAIGATGAGKSRRFFRPLIACALAAGHRVVIIGKSADYWPFEGHPNATLLKVNKITEQGQAQRYAKILEAVVVEMNRRDDVLTAAHQSTWTHAGRNRTFIVLDEAGNALRLMDKESSNQCRIWIEGLVSESRKVGFNIVLANQRATGMASILSQTGKAIFRVEADEERAHRSLAGASTLHDGYFLAKFGVPKIAGAFEPSDEQIKAFLASRPVDKVDDDDQWIEGVLSDAPASLPRQNQTTDVAPQSLSQLVDSLDDKGLKVLELFQAGGISQADIERDVYGYKGGSAANKVAEIIRLYKVATATTPNMSFQGATGQ
jgi:hypothetical protein